MLEKPIAGAGANQDGGVNEVGNAGTKQDPSWKLR